jgi:competence protein ComEC
VAGTGVRVGAWRLSVLSPRRPPSGGEDPNVGSAVVLASAGRLDALLTADAESPTLAALSLLPVEVLKVSHHGSDDPGLGALLRRLRPSLALLSVGANSYGHPAGATLRALAAAHVSLWRTDRSGDVTLTVRRGGVAVTPMRGGAARGDVRTSPG